jgi:MSHA biogenesis protein MshP
MTRASAQSGFGMVMAIVVLVILASLGAAIVKIGTTQQLTSAQGIASARAWAAAKAGAEWGLYQALRPSGAWQNCAATGATQTLNLTASTGFMVTVTCASTPYNEGESAPGTPNEVRVYRISAIACNSSSACPDDARAASPGYVERVREVIATE